VQADVCRRFVDAQPGTDKEDQQDDSNFAFQR
jgi:hypothetical protein